MVFWDVESHYILFLCWSQQRKPLLQMTSLCRFQPDSPNRMSQSMRHRGRRHVSMSLPTQGTLELHTHPSFRDGFVASGHHPQRHFVHEGLFGIRFTVFLPYHNHALHVFRSCCSFLVRATRATLSATCVFAEGYLQLFAYACCWLPMSYTLNSQARSHVSPPGSSRFQLKLYLNRNAAVCLSP